MAQFTGSLFEKAKKLQGAEKPLFHSQLNPWQPNTGKVQVDIVAPTFMQAPEPTTKDDAAGLVKQAGGVVGDMITGDAMNAYRIQQNAALARAEQNQRANTAAQIQRAGFAGTAVGTGYANAAESDMLRNRFDSNLGLEVERQNMRLQGAGVALQYADAVNRFEREGTESRQKAYEDAGRNLAADYQSQRRHYNTLGIMDMTDAGMDRLKREAPTLMHNMQQKWAAENGEGEVPLWYVQTQYRSLSDPVYGNDVLLMEEMFVEAGMDPIQAKALAIFAFNGFLTYNPEANRWEINEEMLKGLSGESGASSSTMPTGIYGSNDPAGAPRAAATESGRPAALGRGL